jgi:hypothetical protein
MYPRWNANNMYISEALLRFKCSGTSITHEIIEGYTGFTRIAIFANRTAIPEGEQLVDSLTVGWTQIHPTKPKHYYIGLKDVDMVLGRMKELGYPIEPQSYVFPSAEQLDEMKRETEKFAHRATWRPTLLTSSERPKYPSANERFNTAVRQAEELTGLPIRECVTEEGAADLLAKTKAIVLRDAAL